MKPIPHESLLMHAASRGRGRRSTLSRRTAAAAMLLAVALAGCATAGKPSAPTSRFDLGSVAPDADGRPAMPARQQAGLAALKVLSVGATPDLNTDRIRYRFAFADAHEVKEYANSRFTMTPAQLFAQRLQVRLAAQGAVLQGDDSVRSPVLKIDLLEFSQVFAAPGQSAGVVALRASLISAGRLLAQRSFKVSRAAGSADAAGGVAALAAASDAAIDEIVQWLAQQPALQAAANAGP